MYSRKYLRSIVVMLLVLVVFLFLLVKCMQSRPLDLSKVNVEEIQSIEYEIPKYGTKNIINQPEKIKEKYEQLIWAIEHQGMLKANAHPPKGCA